MTERRPPTAPAPLSADPLVRALVAALREIAERRAEEVDRRRTMAVLDDERRERAA